MRNALQLSGVTRILNNNEDYIMVDFDEDINKICDGMGDKVDKLKTNKKHKITEVKEAKVNFGGVYLLWEGNKRIYTGRSKNILKRITIHRAANMSTSSFASHLIREKVAKHAKDNFKNNSEKKEYEPEDYMISSFNNDETRQGTTSTEVKKYIETHELKDIIKSEIKERIEKMRFTFIKEEKYLKQILLEIFCMNTLNTMTKKTKLIDNIDTTNFKYKKYNFS